MKTRVYFFSFIVILLAVLAACNKKQTHAMYQGTDISRNAEIIRDKTTKAATLKINVEGKWRLYAGSSVENIDFSTPILEGNGAGTFPLNVNDSVRSYFQLITDAGKAILAEQHLPMTGGYNFRDLGGIQTKEGKYVKWGKLFRSDELANLTESDLEYLAAIPVRTVVDFRSQMEVDNAPDKLPKDASYHHLGIEPGNMSNMGSQFDLSNLQGMDFTGFMTEINRQLVTDSAIIAQYKEFFRLIQNEQDIPLMYHCTAGKDRTGMGSALILYALGADDETVMENYLQSNTYLADKYSAYIQQFPMIEPMMTVKPEYLQAGIDQIRKDHGSVESYLEKILDVDIHKMRKTFLY